MTRRLCEYEAIKELSETRGYSVKKMCGIIGVTRSAYYRWLRNPKSRSEAENEAIAALIKRMHGEHPEMGYRRLADQIRRECGRQINDKRVLRICRAMGIQSGIKWKPRCCTRGARNASHVAGNILNREFTATSPNQKWVTDVTEFKYYSDNEVKKLYLSAILDLYDRRIVAYKVSDSNDNPLVMNTFRKAFRNEKEAHPLCHSDRGFQYTGRQFFTLMEEHGCIHSMSRVGRCIDNGPMEGFWGNAQERVILRQEIHKQKLPCPHDR